MTPQIQQLIEQAIERFQSGSPKQAEDILTRILSTQSNNLPALEILGLIKASQGNHLEAAKLLKKAIKLNPQNPATQYNLAKALSESKDYIGSLIHHEKALQLAPNNPDGWLNYGQALSHLKRYESALTAFTNALSINSNYAEAWYNKALTLSELKRHEEALDCYKNTVQLHPGNTKAWVDMSVCLGILKRFEEAIECCEQAITLDGHYQQGWLNKGSALVELKRFDEAIECFDKAIGLQSDYADAWYSKGVALDRLGKFTEAITCFDKTIYFQASYILAWVNAGVALHQLRQFDNALKYQLHAIMLNHDDALPWANAGASYFALGNYQEAIKFLQNAIALEPDDVKKIVSLGQVFFEVGKHYESLNCYENALKIEPKHKYLAGRIIFSRLIVAKWSNYTERVLALLEAIREQGNASAPLDAMSIINSPNLLLKVNKAFSNSEYPHNDSLGPIQKYSNPKIKLAYFSADFKDHPVAYLTAELFEVHDRNRFEIYAFSTRKAESSLMRERLVAAFDHFIEVDNKSDKEVAELARSLQIDIAIDLGGHTQHARTNIFAHRAAPIQVNYLGFAGTMGANYFDYIVADQIVIPQEFAEFYLEKKVYLPNSYMVDDSQRIPSNKQFSRADFGLPEDAVVFCCFNNSYKFNPPRVASFAKILEQTPNSVLWITENNASFKSNLLAEFEKLGIPANRIIFAGRVDPMADHLARYRLADLFLDTSPYNAHTTAMDSLKAGIPIISLAGQSFASRVGASLLTAVGLPELIVHSENEFLELASKLGRDPQSLKLLKDKLTENLQSTPLFNTRLFAKHLETSYQEMHRRHSNDLPPSDIHVSQ